MFQIGLLSFGIAMLIFDLSDRYLRWKLYGNPSDQLSTEHILGSIISCLFAGLLFGLLTGLIEARRSRD
jgi:hypothetical protein